MPVDFQTLLRRDHADLRLELTQLLDPVASAAELRMALDGVRLGLVAHAEAEEIVLGRFELVPQLPILISQVRAAHRTQEAALSVLVSSRPQTDFWRDRAQHLRELVECHARHEETYFLPALRAQIPDEQFRRLAGAFATERLRQLAMLQPSAPFDVAPFAEVCAS